MELSLRERDVRRGLLSAFIRFLEARLGYTFEIEKEFEKRFRLQKYVFLARFFGLDLGYSYGLHIRGPYSRELADDYYELNNMRVIPESELPKSFDKDRFAAFLSGRDDEWLEAAATLLSVWETNKGVEGYDLSKLINHVSKLKPYIRKSRIKAVAEELRKFKLLG